MLDLGKAIFGFHKNFYKETILKLKKSISKASSSSFNKQETTLDLIHFLSNNQVWGLYSEIKQSGFK